MISNTIFVFVHRREQRERRDIELRVYTTALGCEINLETLAGYTW